MRNLFEIANGGMRTTTGVNMHILGNLGVDLGLILPGESAVDINTVMFCARHQFVKPPSEEEFRFVILNELLSIRTGYAHFEDDLMDLNEVEKIIREICTS